MCKKPDARLVGKIKRQKEEIKMETQTTIAHLEGLAKKHLEKLATSDPIHKRLESLL